MQGRIYDDASGRPLAAATVTLSGPDGERVATTGEDGRYELDGLTPGSYRVYASAPGFAEWEYDQLLPRRPGTSIEVGPGARVRGIEIRLERSSAISGRITMASGDPFPRVEIELLGDRVMSSGRMMRDIPVAYAQTDADGLYRVPDLQPGRYLIRAHTGRGRRVFDDETGQLYIPTFFPNVTALDFAQDVLVGAAQDLVGFDFELNLVDTFTVAGWVAATTTASRALRQPRVVVTRFASMIPEPIHDVPVADDGSFVIERMAADEYELRVGSEDDGIPHFVMPSTRLSVTGDRDDLVLPAPRIGRLSGRIVSHDGRPLSFDPTKIRLAKQMRPGGGVSATIGSGTEVRSDGTFVVDGVTGPTLLSVQGVPAGWLVRAIRMGATDITYDAVDFGNGRDDLEIVLGDRPAPLTGVAGYVTDRRGERVSGSTVVLFSADRERWIHPSRHLQGLRTDVDGAFLVPGMPPGDYLAVAVEPSGEVAWQEREVLERLWSEATPFTLAEGEQRRLDLRTVRAPTGR